ncbi:MAG: DNA-binding protein [Synergistaceae bacterium]|nr:DNA-binding protein [Synergistaceae bacterium]
MHYRKFGNKYYVRMDRGEEILSQLKVLCEHEHITLAEVKALGAIDDFSVGLFDVAEKKYHVNRFTFPAEIVSLWGTVTTKDGEFYAHVHMSAGDKEGRVFGGHLNSAVVSATCEMIIDVSEGRIERRLDDDVGLNLFDFTD